MKTLSLILVIVLALSIIAPSISAYSYYSKPTPVYAPSYYAQTYAPSNMFYPTTSHYTLVQTQSTPIAVLPGVTYAQSKDSAANYMKNVKKMEAKQKPYPSLLKQYKKEEKEIAGHYHKGMETASNVIGLLGFFCLIVRFFPNL